MRSLLWLAPWLAVGVVACGGKKPSTTTPTGTGDGEPVITVQTLLGWGTQGYDPEATAPRTKVYLEVTDHHGQTQSYPLEDVAAPCTAMAGNGADIVTALSCLQDGSGAEYRAVYRGADVIVLRRRVAPGDDPADIELSFQELTRVPVPAGSKVKPAS